MTASAASQRRNDYRKKLRARPFTAGEAAMFSAMHARKDTIRPWLQDLQYRFRELAGYGFEISQELREAMLKVVAQIEASLAVHLCPQCAGGASVNCTCKGRGYFDRTQDREYELAVLRGRRTSNGDNRTIRRLIADAAARKMLPRREQLDMAAAFEAEMMQEAFNE